MVHGAWCMVRGAWCLDEGTAPGSCLKSEAEPLHQLPIVIDARIGRCEELLARKDRIGACHETERLRLCSQRKAPCGQTHTRLWRNQSRRSNGANELERIKIVGIG